MDPATANQMMYDALFSALVQHFPTTFGVSNGALDPRLQYQFPDPANLQPANWVDPLEDVDFEAAQCLLGDRPPLLKGARYAPDSAQSIFTSYGDWIDSVEASNPATNPEYREALRVLMDAGARMQQIAEIATPSFRAWQQENPGALANLTAWLTASPPLIAAQPYATQYAIASQEYNHAAAKTTQIVEVLNRPLGRAQAAADDPAFQKKYAIQGTSLSTIGQTQVGDVFSDPVENWTNWQQGGSLNQNPFQSTITSGTVPQYTVQPVTIEVTETYSYFFGLFSSTTTEQQTFFQQVVDYQNFQIELSFASVNPYTISRQGWYSLDVLQGYAPTKYIYNGVDFFNPTSGPLYLVPRTVFLGWNPVVKLTIDDALFQAWKPTLDADGGTGGIYVNGVLVGVGIPYTQSASPIQGAVELTFGDQGNPESRSTVPTVLGFVHDVIDGYAPSRAQVAEAEERHERVATTSGAEEVAGV
ncbi:MAG TPA: hypothetical protein VFT45_26495 [Longimicrobium sp.]|nr:hypothetical protein [Longimicrobium sp.]